VPYLQRDAFGIGAIHAHCRRCLATYVGPVVRIIFQSNAVIDHRFQYQEFKGFWPAIARSSVAFSADGDGGTKAPELPARRFALAVWLAASRNRSGLGSVCAGCSFALNGLAGVAKRADTFSTTITPGSLGRLLRGFFLRGQSPLQREHEQHVAKHGIVSPFSGAGVILCAVFISFG
jgi:hypothetical protein